MTNLKTTLALCSATILFAPACGDDDGDDHEHSDDGGDAGRHPDGGKAGSGGSRAGTGGNKPPTGGKAGSAGSGGRGSQAGDGGAVDAGAGSGGHAGSDDTDASVDDEDAGGPQQRRVTIRFKAKVGSADFACGQSYAGQGSTNVEVLPQDFRFCVQDLRLVTAGGDEVPVTYEVRSPWQSEGVALLDFENGADSCAGEGDADLNTEITGTVPEGHYTGVRFVNGVPEQLNHGDETTLPPPLQKGGLSWGWLFGYRFMKAELVQVLAPPATESGSGYAHSGSTGCTGTEATGFSCTKQNRNEIRLTGFDPDTDTIIADIGALFAGSDLSQDVQCHGSGDACMPMFPRLGIDYTTGNPSPATQQVYRVE